MLEIKNYEQDFDILEKITEAGYEGNYTYTNGKVLEITFPRGILEEVYEIRQEIAWVDYGEEEKENEYHYTSFCQEVVQAFSEGIPSYGDWKKENQDQYIPESFGSESELENLMKMDYEASKPFYEGMQEVAEYIAREILPEMKPTGFIKNTSTGEVMTGSAYKQQIEEQMKQYIDLDAYVPCDKSGKLLTDM